MAIFSLRRRKSKPLATGDNAGGKEDVALLQEAIAAPDRLPPDAKADFFVTQVRLKVKYRPEEDEEALLLQWLAERGFMDVVAIPYKPSTMKPSSRLRKKHHYHSNGLDLCVWVTDQRIIRAAIDKDPSKAPSHPRNMLPEERAALVEDALSILEHARAVGVIEYHKIAPLHDRKALKEVKSCCSDIVISEQSVSLMARYFGTRVGFFFAWVQFYVLSLCFPAVFGVYIWWRQHASGPAVQEDESTAMLTDTLTPCFNIFLALWGAIFLQYWKRRSAWLAYKWGVHQADSMARNKALARRHDFDANSPESMSLMNSTGWELLYILRLALSLLLELIVLGLGVALMIVYTRIEEELRISNQGMAQRGVRALYAIVPIFFSGSHKRLAQITTAWEGHLSEPVAEDIFTLKLFAYEFVYSYSSLLYFTFWKRDVARLESTLFTLLTARQLLQLMVAVILPKLKQLFHRFRGKMNPGAGVGTGSLRETSCRRGESVRGLDKEKIIMQMCKERFAGKFSVHEEYLEYGYVSMFAVAAPLAPLFAIIRNIIDARVDAWKVSTSMRPRHQARSNIGSWLKVLDFISMCSVVTNSVLVSLTSPKVAELYIPNALEDVFPCSKQALAAVFFGHTLMLVKYILKSIIPPIPADVEHKQAADALEQYYAQRSQLHVDLGIADDVGNELRTSVRRRSPRNVDSERRRSANGGLSRPSTWGSSAFAAATRSASSISGAVGVSYHSQGSAIHSQATSL